MAFSDGSRRRGRQPYVRFGNPLEEELNHRYYPGPESARRRPRDGDVIIAPRRDSRAEARVFSSPLAYEEMPDPIQRPRRASRMVGTTRGMPEPYRLQQSIDREAINQERMSNRIQTVRVAEPSNIAAVRYTNSPPALTDNIDSEEQPAQRIRRRDSSLSRAKDETVIIERDRESYYGSDDPKVYVEQADGYFPSYRPHSPIIDDTDAFDDFNFELSPEPSKEGETSDLETPSTETGSTQKAEVSPSRDSTAPGIYSSSYTGAAELGGLHNITLTMLHDPRGRKSPIFRWLHVRQSVMNFDDLWNEISRQVRFSEVERTTIARLRAEVKRVSIKSRYNPKGAKVGYMEPHCFQMALESSPKTPSESSESSGIVSWVCIPYFSLQHYSGLLSASNVALFPAQTLLQSQYSRSTQQRDMEQAVCQLGIVERGECFHIAQLWCLVVNNSLLVTCGTMAQDELQGDNVKMSSEPSQAIGSGRILVSYGEAVVWSLTTRDCPTWFAFLSHFHSFWPRNLEFRRNNQVQTARTWSKILKLAQGPRGSVTLKLSIIDPPDPPRAFLKPQDGAKPIAAEKSRIDRTSVEYLHVLTLSPHGLASSLEGRLKSLHGQLAGAEKFLAEQTSYSAQIGYKACDEITRGDVYTYLTGLAIKVEEKNTDSFRRSYDERIDIFNAADIIFQLFFPITFDGPTTGKFWGALNKLIRIPGIDDEVSSYNSQLPTVDIRSSLWSLSQDIQVFESVLSFAEKAERDKIELPREFAIAWLHVVSGMIYSSQAGNWWGHLAKAKALIRVGMQKILQGLSSEDLLKKAVMLPMEVLCLISLNLLQDQKGKYEDITETYSQYLNSLDTDITTKPSDRSYQHRIDLVNQEMTAIKRIIVKQKNIVNILRFNSNPAEITHTVRYVEEGPFTRRRGGREREAWDRDPMSYYHGVYERPANRVAGGNGKVDDQFITDLESASKLSPTDAAGFRGLFLAECASIVDQREYEFKRDTEYAEDLEREINYRMEWTKDKQENAIYAFTLVTIIFLPISAISSIFGMNTNDIRNMDFDQWLYWVVALPVTVLVIIAGLWWMNELDNLTRWMVGKKQPRYRVVGNAASVSQPVVITPQNIRDSDSEAESEGISRYHRPYRPEMSSRIYVAPVSTPAVAMPLRRRRRDSFYRY